MGLVHKMNYKRLKKYKWLCAGLLFSTIIYILCSSDTRENNNETIGGTAKTRDVDFDKYCEEFGEWQMLRKREIFIKRTAVFYFLDADKLLIQMIMRPELHTLPAAFLVRVTLLKNRRVVSSFEAQRRYTHVRMHEFRFNYSATFIEATPNNNLEQMYLSEQFDSMKVKVIHEKNRNKNKHTDEFLNAKIKYIQGDASKKKGVMFCGKCLRFTKKDDFNDLKWWIQMLRRTGFDKIHFAIIRLRRTTRFLVCSNSIKTF
jgi:hypothetical protein